MPQNDFNSPSSYASVLRAKSGEPTFSRLVNTTKRRAVKLWMKLDSRYISYISHYGDYHQLLQTFIVWILCMSPEVRKVDAACQVHVWHVSEGYTIISSSSLSEFIVLNFCPSLNIRWKHGMWLQLVNGCPSQGICWCFCVCSAYKSLLFVSMFGTKTLYQVSPQNKKKKETSVIKFSFMNVIKASLTRRDGSETVRLRLLLIYLSSRSLR